MALELRPSCEHCDRSLPPHATDAMICSFECTFCRTCVDEILLNVCPNCGGGFEARPIRPAHNHRNGNYLGQYPAASNRRHRPVDLADHKVFAARLSAIRANER
jgi:uncharacterized protein